MSIHPQLGPVKLIDHTPKCILFVLLLPSQEHCAHIQLFAFYVLPSIRAHVNYAVSSIEVVATATPPMNMSITTQCFHVLMTTSTRSFQVQQQIEAQGSAPPCAEVSLGKQQ